MAKGQEAYETGWLIDNYKTSFVDADLTHAGFNWRVMGGLDLSTNVDSVTAGYTLPEFSLLLVLVVVTTTGAAISNPVITVIYADSLGAGFNTTTQLIQGTPAGTSKSLALTSTGIVTVAGLSRSVASSGTISVLSADSIAEQFNYPVSWSAASPGL